MKRIYIYAEGSCWNRQLDANKIRNYLLKNDYYIVEKPELADVIIFVSCAFLNNRQEFSLEKVKEFKKYSAELIVAGCLPATGKDDLSKVFHGKTLTTKELNKIEDLFPANKNVKFKDTEDANLIWENKDKKSSTEKVKKIFRFKIINHLYFKTKDRVLKNLLGENSIEYQFLKKQFHIRISWGCTGNCSYCTIKNSTEPHHSKPFDKCIIEFKKGLEQGYQNFVLDATDVGAYGIDIETNFTELLDQMTKIPGNYHIMIREIHPKWIIKYIDKLEEILKRNKILILDIAIQSVNDRILKLMNRPTDVEKMKKALLRLKRSSPDIAYTCEFIIGFPTETEEEFKQSIDFIKEIDFTGGQIYIISIRKGTEAEKIEPKITESMIIKRVQSAKKFLKKEGYYVKYMPEERMLLFSKKN